MQLFNDLTAILQFKQKTMKMETLVVRISQCIDDLGLLLDLIYKFPQKQRQIYFDRIQGMKNKLLLLKSNMKESNTSVTQKQYKQLYLATNTLKNEIQQQISLIPSVKENKEMNRYKDVRDVRKNYEESMKLLVVKEQQIKNLKELLYEKQELLRINCDELYHLKQEYQLMIQSNRSKNIDQNNYEVQLERRKKSLLRAQSDIIEMKHRQEEKDRAFNSAIQELQKLKIELITANQRIINLNHLLEVNKAKTRVAEDIIKTDRSSQVLRQSHCHPQDPDSFRKIREVSQLEYEIDLKNSSLKDIQQQNKHLKEDIEVLESQINKLQGKNNEQKIQATRQKDNLLFQQKRIEKEHQASLVREAELKKLLEEAEKKYLAMANKLNVAEQFKMKMKESDFQNELLSQKISSLEAYIQKLQNEVKILSKQKEKVFINKERDDIVIRQLEVDLFKANERLKMKEEEIKSIIRQSQSLKSRIRQYEKELTLRERKQKSIESNLFEQKTRMIKLEQKDKARNKEIQGLKVKLLRAKIETIHQIRETIN